MAAQVGDRFLDQRRAQAEVQHQRRQQAEAQLDEMVAMGEFDEASGEELQLSGLHGPEARDAPQDEAYESSGEASDSSKAALESYEEMECPPGLRTPSGLQDTNKGAIDADDPWGRIVPDAPGDSGVESDASADDAGADDDRYGGGRQPPVGPPATSLRGCISESRI